VPAASWFSNLFDARSKITDWRKEYKELRPHSSLNYRTLTEFVEALENASYGKDADLACLENSADAFPTLPQLLLRGKFVFTNMRILGHVNP
jgi:Integrase core domain